MNTVKVTNVEPSLSKEVLAMYFENAKRSQGGEIKHLLLITEKKKAFITFKDPSGMFTHCASSFYVCTLYTYMVVCIVLFWIISPQKVLIKYTHIRLTALFLGLPGWASTRKVKPVWILQKQETVSGSGISWAICKYATRFRQTTTPAPHHSVFSDRMPFLPPNQQRQSTEGTSI